MTRLGRARAWALDHPLAAAEVALALGLFAVVLGSGALRGLLWAVLHAAATGAASWFALLPVDGAGTVLCGLAAAARVALVVAPAVRLARSLPVHRRAWLPLYGALVIATLPMWFAAFSTVRSWIALAAASLLGWLAAAPRRRPLLRWCALLPQLLALEPLTGHGPLGDLVWTRSRLAARCATDDGAPATGFALDLASTRFFGITPLDDELALLTGERASLWLRRTPGGFRVVEPSAAVGNLWQGCALGRDLWLAKRGMILRVERLSDGAPPHERVSLRRLPDPPGVVELDLVDAVCDPAARAVYVSELLGGGLRVLSLDDGAVARRDLGAGENLQIVRRSDGNLVAIDTAQLLVYDPRADRVLERHRAGICALGLDVCAADGTAAIADFAGRVRLFRRASDGSYAFERATSLTAPRRVAFAPDCRTLAVTSGDDRTVTILRRADLATVRRFTVGPGLRDVSYVGAREVAVAHACGATVLDGGE